MLTEQELRALAQLLNKTPMSQAELLWTQQFINEKLQPLIPAPQKEEQKEEDE